MCEMRIYVDGSSQSYRRRAGIGLVVTDTSGAPVLEACQPIPYCSSDRAECLAILEALEIARQLEIDRYELLSDCQWIVDRVAGIPAPIHPDATRICGKIRRRMARTPRVRLSHVPRAGNRHADALARSGARGFRSFGAPDL